MPSFRVNPFKFLDKFFIAKTSPWAIWQQRFALFWLKACISVLYGLRSRSTADSDPQFFLRTRSVRGSDDGKQPRTRTVRGSKLHLAHIKLTLRSSGRMYPVEKQTMQLQARAACASAMHVISAAGVRKSSVIWRVSKDAISGAQLTRPLSPVTP